MGGAFPYINSPQFTGNFPFQVKESIHYFEVTQFQIESICLMSNIHCGRYPQLTDF